MPDWRWQTGGEGREEMWILRSSRLILQENTKRQETVDEGANTLVGANSARILNAARQMMKNGHQWTNPLAMEMQGDRS